MKELRDILREFTHASGPMALATIVGISRSRKRRYSCP